MKLKKFFFVSLCLFLVMGYGYIYMYGEENQNHTLDQTTRLAGLCKAWGLLKYYHPDVATGEIDWDAVLTAAVPAVKNAGDFDSFNQEIANLIQEAGGIEKLDYNPNTPAHPNEDLFKWIKDPWLFNQEVIHKLKTVQKKHAPANNYYVQFTGLTPAFENENPYGELYYPDENFRLLALFRYWNIVNYFFPYRDMTDMEWEDVLEKFIPRFINASDSCEYQRVILELAAHINDGHGVTGIPAAVSCTYTPLYAPFEVRYIEDKTVVTQVYPDLLNSPGDIEIGDIILKYDNIAIDVFRNEKIPVTPSANEACIRKYINRAVQRGDHSPFRYTLLRNGQVKDTAVNMYDLTVITNAKNAQDSLLDKWKILPGNIGYINMGIFYPIDVFQAMPELMDTRAIIFDHRFHAQGACYYLPYFLFPKLTEVYELFLVNTAYPGDFLHGIIPMGYENPNYYKGKVVILVNENTISHSEFSSMILQAAPDTVVIGSQTAGTDGNMVSFMLPGGIKTSISGLGVSYPDGTPTQRVGIAIDIEAYPSLAGIRVGQDEVLEKAFEFIENSKK
jgi:carboxyl-terminal processing protease